MGNRNTACMKMASTQLALSMGIDVHSIHLE